MTSKKIFLYALFLSFVFCAIYMEAQDTNEEEAITKTIQNAIGWANNKDINLLYNIIADDDKFLEVHPGDKAVKGIRSLKMLKFWMNPDSKAVRYEIKDLNITISKSGYVAWWFCILDDINETNDQMRQLNEVFANPLGAGTDLDEDDLLNELQELEASELEKELLEPAPVPTTKVPAAKRPTAIAAAKTKVKSDEELELEALQAEMAL